MGTKNEEIESAAIEIIVGTYEEFLLGYKLSVNDKKGEHKYKLEQSFTNHSHSGSIRSVAIVGKYLASGSVDEAIRLVNMALRVEHGYMQQQTGNITCLTNYGSKYLFSGCTDGTICIWKSGSWICEKTLKAHEGGVNDVSIHPSGKLALSVGMDRSLKTWNLIKGRTGFVTNLHGVGDVVRWSPEGTYYAVGVSNRLDVYNVETAKVVYSVPFGKRVSSVCFPKDDVVVIAGDRDIVEVHSIKKFKKLSEFKAHQVRVKDMRFVEQHDMLVTGSNCDQCIKIWRFSNDSCSEAPTLLTEFDTTCRITCLTVWSKPISKSQTDIAQAEAEKETLPIEEEDEEAETPKKSSKKPNAKTQKPVESKTNKQLKDLKRKKKNKEKASATPTPTSPPTTPNNKDQSSNDSKSRKSPRNREKAVASTNDTKPSKSPINNKKKSIPDKSIPDKPSKSPKTKKQSVSSEPPTKKKKRVESK